VWRKGGANRKNSRGILGGVVGVVGASCDGEGE